MEGQQLPPHGSVGKAELDVALNPPQQGLVVIAEKVRGHHHHSLEAVQLLHQAIPVLVNRGHARFIETDSLGKKAGGLVEEENRTVMSGPLEGPLEVLGCVAGSSQARWASGLIRPALQPVVKQGSRGFLHAG
jgi:hypothetical protein